MELWLTVVGANIVRPKKFACNCIEMHNKIIYSKLKFLGYENENKIQ